MVLSSEKERKFYVFLYLAKRKKNSQLDILLFIIVALLYHLSFLSYSFQTAHVLRDVKKFRKRFLPIEVLSFFFFFFSKNESMNLYDIISMSNEVIAFCNSISFLNVLCNCDIPFFSSSSSRSCLAVSRTNNAQTHLRNHDNFDSN